MLSLKHLLCYKGMLNLKQCDIQMLHSNNVQVWIKMILAVMKYSRFLCVHPDLKWLPCSLLVLPPLLHHSHDGQHLFVMHLIVPFHLIQHF